MVHQSDGSEMWFSKGEAQMILIHVQGRILLVRHTKSTNLHTKSTNILHTKSSVRSRLCLEVHLLLWDNLDLIPKDLSFSLSTLCSHFLPGLRRCSSVSHPLAKKSDREEKRVHISCNLSIILCSQCGFLCCFIAYCLIFSFLFSCWIDWYSYLMLFRNPWNSFQWCAIEIDHGICS